MTEIKLRDIQLVYDGETLTISSVEQPEKSVALDPTTVEQLVEFVHLLTPPPPEPAEPQGANRRESFRVPVIDASGLSVTLILGKKRHESNASNISMTGLFVDVPKDSAFDLKIDDELRARLSMDGTQIELEAIVRRAESYGFGLFFPESVKGEHVDPHPTLRRIVMELQRRWMTHFKNV